PLRDKHTLEAMAMQIAAFLARVKAEQTIFENQLEISTVFDSFKYMFIVTNTEFEIQSINNVVSEYFGFEEDTIIGKTIDDIYKIENDEKDNLRTALLSGAVIRLENQLADIGGESVKVETRVAAGKQNNENTLYFMSWPTSAQ
ncbi:MAG: PAS domain-containing protein, partial [Candidatus Thorarchaeota archaeon]